MSNGTQTDSTAPPSPGRRRGVRAPRLRSRRLRPERRRRGDLVAVAVIVVLVLVAAALVWGTSAVRATVDDTATEPIAAPAPAAVVPDGFTEAWRAPSGATAAPVATGSAAVTADGSTVIGHDASTGAERWRYSRDLPLCTVGAGFPDSDGAAGRVLALYRGRAGGCSELTALRPGTGARLTASNPDAAPGTRLVADGSFVVATGSDHLEVWRSDLVRTLEYGRVVTPVQVGSQPRTGCTYGSTALMASRVGVVERCPGETTDRLTVLKPDGADSEKPEADFSVLLPATGATVVALSTDRVAVALPDPARLLILDRTGVQVGLISLDVPDTDLTAALEATPGDGAPATVSSDGERVYWWTGSQTVALDATDLAPLWTAPGTLGPAVAYGDGLLVPVPGGLAQLDPVRGTVLRVLPVTRDDPGGPVRITALGEVLLEQRGTELVALRPAAP